MGPTAGYLYGMLMAAVVIGYLSERGFSTSYFMCAISLLIGSIIIFTLGVGYLSSIIGFDKAINAGLIPFLPSELFKLALAVAIIPSLSKNFK
jgi:biotin transport system substrate-specific component